MCGRYNLITDAQAIMDAFDIANDMIRVDDIHPRFNISPSTNRETHKIPIIRHTPAGRELMSVVWPMIPHWAHGKLPKYNTANARAESMRGAPSYRHAWYKQQRCLIPATGFYEWQIIPGKHFKQPYHVYLRQQPLFAFAGLWESSASDEGEAVDSCTIVTTEANSLLAEIHKPQRMPVILELGDYETWLTGTHDHAYTCVKSYPTESMKADKISTKVNNPSHDEPDCIEAIE